jgi:hypothetical protein
MERLHHELKKLQEACPHHHERLIKTHKDIGDGWSVGKAGSHYITNFVCLDCGKQWTEDGSK